MPTIVDCPSCERKLRVPDDMLGKKVKCPKCGTTFTARGDDGGRPVADGDEPPGRSAVQERSSQAEERYEEDRPPRRPRDEYEDEEEDDYRQPMRRRRRSRGEPHRGTLILILGIGSIACLVLGLIATLLVGPFSIILFLPGLGVGIPSWAMGGRDLSKINARRMDPEGKSMTMAGYIMGIVGTILNGLCMLCCVGLILLGLLGLAALHGLSKDLERQQKKQLGPPSRFEQGGSPLRLQEYLPAAYR
ncbi:MAG TPA: zinc-ribbon domain-containing protein [Gemmataceae bacterium]|nr:zinc-ribbon domain-containing protein [Gemmataceae bacterium]